MKHVPSPLALAKYLFGVALSALLIVGGLAIAGAFAHIAWIWLNGGWHLIP